MCETENCVVSYEKEVGFLFVLRGNIPFFVTLLENYKILHLVLIDINIVYDTMKTVGYICIDDTSVLNQ